MSDQLIPGLVPDQFPGDPVGDPPQSTPSPGVTPTLVFPLMVMAVNYVARLAGNVDFEVTAGDTPPALVVTLCDATGAAVDISGATLLAFHLGPLYGGATLITGTAVFVTDGTDGQIKYAFSDADMLLLTLGDYVAEFYVEWGSALRAHFPTDPKITVRVNRAI